MFFLKILVFSPAIGVQSSKMAQDHTNAKSLCHQQLLPNKLSGNHDNECSGASSTSLQKFWFCHPSRE